MTKRRSGRETPAKTCIVFTFDATFFDVQYNILQHSTPDDNNLSTMSTTQALAVRPYRDFLTPFLHRRFTNAALLTLALCYVEAVWMGQWGIFWQWFPLGRAGLRTLMLFVSILSVYVLRIAQLHVGARTTLSPFHTFQQRVFSFNALQTLAWYTFSAWFFCEVYIWSTPADAKMAMVDPGKYDGTCAL